MTFQVFFKKPRSNKEDFKYECAEESVSVLVGESPTWAKVSRQPNTKFHI